MFKLPHGPLAGCAKLLRILIASAGIFLFAAACDASPVTFSFQGVDQGVDGPLCPACTAMGSFTVDSSLFNGSTFDAIPFADITSFMFEITLPGGEVLTFTLSDLNGSGNCSNFIGCLFFNTSGTNVIFLGSSDGTAITTEGYFTLFSNFVFFQTHDNPVDVEYNGQWTIGAPVSDIGAGMSGILASILGGLIWFSRRRWTRPTRVSVSGPSSEPSCLR